MLDELAKRIKEIRSSKNMTMGEFGDLGDVSATTQGAYEREDPEERRYPDARYLLNLKNHGIDIHYLLTGEKSPEDVISTKSMEIVNAYENADDDHKAIFEAVAKASLTKPKGRVDKKRDDSDPPAGGTSNKMDNITAFGDVLQDSQKSTTHNNFNSPSIEEIDQREEAKRIADQKRNFKLEDVFHSFWKKENMVKALCQLFTLALVIFLFKEQSEIFPVNTFEEQMASLLGTITLSIFGFVLYRELSKQVTHFFDDLREKARRRILLE